MEFPVLSRSLWRFTTIESEGLGFSKTLVVYTGEAPLFKGMNQGKRRRWGVGVLQGGHPQGILQLVPMVSLKPPNSFFLCNLLKTNILTPKQNCWFGEPMIFLFPTFGVLSGVPAVFVFGYMPKSYGIPSFAPAEAALATAISLGFCGKRSGQQRIGL